MRKELTVSRIYPNTSSRPLWQIWSYPVPEPLPFIRMSGQWLRRLGFHAGSKIEVEAERGRLVLRAVPAREPASEICEPEAEG